MIAIRTSLKSCISSLQLVPPKLKVTDVQLRNQAVVYISSCASSRSTDSFLCIGRQYHSSSFILEKATAVGGIKSSNVSSDSDSNIQKNSKKKSAGKIKEKDEEPLDLLTMVMKDSTASKTSVTSEPATPTVDPSSSTNENTDEEDEGTVVGSKIVDEAELLKKKEEKLKKKMETKQRELTKKEIREKQLKIQMKRNEKAAEKAQKTQAKKQQQKKKDDSDSDAE